MTRSCSLSKMTPRHLSTDLLGRVTPENSSVGRGETAAGRVAAACGSWLLGFLASASWDSLRKTGGQANQRPAIARRPIWDRGDRCCGVSGLIGGPVGPGDVAKNKVTNSKTPQWACMCRAGLLGGAAIGEKRDELGMSRGFGRLTLPRPVAANPPGDRQGTSQVAENQKQKQKQRKASICLGMCPCPTHLVAPPPHAGPPLRLAADKIPSVPATKCDSFHNCPNSTLRSSPIGFLVFASAPRPPQPPVTYRAAGFPPQTPLPQTHSSRNSSKPQPWYGPETNSSARFGGLTDIARRRQNQFLGPRSPTSTPVSTRRESSLPNTSGSTPRATAAPRLAYVTTQQTGQQRP